MAGFARGMSFLDRKEPEQGVMRSGPNPRRLRGRGSNSNRRNNAPRNQNFESNGPDVKVRGNAQQVVEKYLQLARDASTAGDPVAAENYFQHAEHYYRLQTAMADRAAQRQQQDQQQPRSANDGGDGEDDREEAVRATPANGGANGNGADMDFDEPSEMPAAPPPATGGRSRAKSSPAATVEAVIEASREPAGDQPG
jgi:hypothetical protein